MVKKDDLDLEELIKKLKDGKLADFMKECLEKLARPRTLEETKEFLIKKLKEVKTENDLKHFALKMAETVLTDYHCLLDKNKEEK